jgi:hypothetical protein
VSDEQVLYDPGFVQSEEKIEMPTEQKSLFIQRLSNRLKEQRRKETPDV